MIRRMRNYSESKMIQNPHLQIPTLKCTLWTAVDLLLILIMLLLLAALVNWTTIGTVDFPCQNRQNLQYPYMGDTVSHSLLYVVGSVVPVTFFYVTELASESHRASKDYICVSLTEVIRVTVLYTFGAAVTLIFTHIGKVSTMRLQPNFLATCKPNITFSNCTKGFTNLSIDNCQNKQVYAWEIKSSFCSFPSVHAALSAYSMVYLVIYLQARLKVTFSVLFCPLLQAGAICVAYYIALTRISDYKHHWVDVIAGSFLGILLGVYVAVKVTNLFYKKTKAETKTSKSVAVSTNTRKMGSSIEIGEHTHLFDTVESLEVEHPV
ncbi:phospholipid phosphatase 1-like [Tubulanus polymorphus]|uniref:phospholipid phosphatase 1-like n=1 Tax=Tubulanus polymorphus TaxID=672921 RepID=UPI003DA2C49D